MHWRFLKVWKSIIRAGKGGSASSQKLDENKINDNSWKIKQYKYDKILLKAYKSQIRLK